MYILVVSYCFNDERCWNKFSMTEERDADSNARCWNEFSMIEETNSAWQRKWVQHDKGNKFSMTEEMNVG